MPERRPRTIKPHTTAQARRLREEVTPAERKLWKRLRARQVLGLKFRRQQPVGRYIVDFYCPAARVVVEIDGDTHAESEDEDAERTEWLEGEGYRVIRFVNADVHERIDLVVNRIAEECRSVAGAKKGTEGEETAYPSPYPLPQGERDEEKEED